MTKDVIMVEGLTKVFNKSVVAVEHLDSDVKEGKIFRFGARLFTETLFQLPQLKHLIIKCFYFDSDSLLRDSCFTKSICHIVSNCGR